MERVDYNDVITQKIIDALAKELGSLVKVERYESNEEVVSLTLKYVGSEEFESVVISLDRDLLESAKKDERRHEMVKQISEGFWKAASAFVKSKKLEDVLPHLAIVPMEIPKESKEYKMYIKHNDESLPENLTGILVADMSDQLNVIVESYCSNWNVKSEALVQKVLGIMRQDLPEIKLIIEELSEYRLESLDGRDFVEAFIREDVRYLSTSLLYVDDFKEIGELHRTNKLLAVFLTASDVMYLDYNDPLHMGFAYVIDKMFDRSGLHSSTRHIYSINVETGRKEYVDKELLKTYFEMNYVPPVIKN